MLEPVSTLPATAIRYRARDAGLLQMEHVRPAPRRALSSARPGSQLCVTRTHNTSSKTLTYPRLRRCSSCKKRSVTRRRVETCFSDEPPFTASSSSPMRIQHNMLQLQTISRAPPQDRVNPDTRGNTGVASIHPSRTREEGQEEPDDVPRHCPRQTPSVCARERTVRANGRARRAQLRSRSDDRLGDEKAILLPGG